MDNKHVNEEALQDIEAQEAEVTFSQVTGGRGNRAFAVSASAVGGGVAGFGTGAGISKGNMGAMAAGAGVGATAGLATGLAIAAKMK